MIRRIFPNEYSLDEIKKYQTARAYQFDDSRDAFQQLVGDALNKVFGSSAFISPTRGNDGSIDAYIDGNAGEPKYPFESLELPIIIECKSHESSTNLSTNVENEWGKLRKKLTEQSEAGWDKLFEPWKRAKSYVYCISANITSEDFYQKLTEKIDGFFKNLPEENRPPIEEVRVLDWKMLKTWFDDIPQLCDLWLGIDSSLVIEHQTFKSSLAGFKRFLLSRELGFVEPEADSPFHPQNIYKRLISEEDKNNVLIVGSGGVGKTRTSTEVAELAATDGWRVLHVLAGEPEIENKDLAEVVLPYSGKTLLIFDYVDQMPNLDLGNIRSSLIPTAKERGNQVAVLGNSRPGWLREEKIEREKLFYTVELKPSDAQRERIISKVITEIAPVACQKLGYSDVRELCGGRSIIALLIALELERLAGKEDFSKNELAGIKSGDLIAWLRKRLGEDNLVAKQDSNRFKQPESWLIISAAVLACSPGYLEFLLEIADEVNKFSDAGINTEFLVDTLIDLGWLEKAFVYYSTPHDVVADEVFDQTVHFGKFVHEASLYKVLSPALSIPRSLGRFAITFERVLGAIKDEEQYQRIKQTAEKWLAESAKELGQSLAFANSDVSGYSIGAVLNGALWRDTAIEKWGEIVQPWLDQHGTKPAARHLLYKGLRKIDSLEKINLISITLSWLDQFAKTTEASYITPRLLSRDELTVDEAKTAIDYALQWLEKDENFLSPDTRFVLPSLLSRDELTVDEAKTAINYALQWLEKDENFLRFDAQFVYNQLLPRDELTADDAKTAINYALQWLKNENQFLTLEGSFVLPSLLNRDELTVDKAKTAIKYALQWLEKDENFLRFDARFVLPSLLNRDELTVDKAKTAIDYALQWLKNENQFLTLEGRFVLPSLLSRDELTVDEAKTAIKYALQWLEKDENFLRFDAGFVFPPLLLILEDFDLQAEGLIQKSLQWLEVFFDTQDAEFVIKRLSLRKEVGSEKVESLIRSILVRLKARVNDEEATFLIRWCLQRKIENPELDSERIKVAVAWLNNNKANSNADFVWNRVLRNERTDDEDWKTVSNTALSWLKSKDILEKNVDNTINSLLVRSNLLSKNNLRDLLERGINWIKSRQNKGSPDEIKSAHRNIRWAISNCSDKFDLMDIIEEFEELNEQRNARFKFFEVQKSIKEKAGDLSFIPGINEVKEICETIIEQGNYSIKSAGYTIVPLLIIGIRAENQISEVIEKTVRSILDSDELPANIKQKIKLVFEDELNKLNMVLSPEKKTWLEQLGILATSETV